MGRSAGYNLGAIYSPLQQQQQQHAQSANGSATHLTNINNEIYSIYMVQICFHLPIQPSIHRYDEWHSLINFYFSTSIITLPSRMCLTIRNNRPLLFFLVSCTIFSCCFLTSWFSLKLFFECEKMTFSVPASIFFLFFFGYNSELWTPWPGIATFEFSKFSIWHRVIWSALAAISDAS